MWLLEQKSRSFSLHVVFKRIGALHILHQAQAPRHGTKVKGEADCGALIAMDPELSWFTDVHWCSGELENAWNSWALSFQSSAFGNPSASQKNQWPDSHCAVQVSAWSSSWCTTWWFAPHQEGPSLAWCVSWPQGLLSKGHFCTRTFFLRQFCDVIQFAFEEVRDRLFDLFLCSNVLGNLEQLQHNSLTDSLTTVSVCWEHALRTT